MLNARLCVQSTQNRVIIPIEVDPFKREKGIDRFIDYSDIDSLRAECCRSAGE
jgi:hypothetical protein